MGLGALVQRPRLGWDRQPGTRHARSGSDRPTRVILCACHITTREVMHGDSDITRIVSTVLRTYHVNACYALRLISLRLRLGYDTSTSFGSGAIRHAGNLHIIQRNSTAPRAERFHILLPHAGGHHSQAKAERAIAYMPLFRKRRAMT